MIQLLLAIPLLFAESYVSIETPTEISDPKKLLEKVDQTLGQKTFVESYTCDKEAPMKKYVDNCAVQCPAGFCVASVCENIEQDYNQYALGCDGDEHGIYNELGDFIEFNKEGFQTVNNNPVRLFLMNLHNLTNQQGRIVLDKIEPTKFTISSTGEKVDAFHLTGTFYHNDTGFPDWFLITYSPHLPLIAQPLRYRTKAITPLTGINGITWFRFQGFPQDNGGN